jgi:hypothetical protein
VGCQWLEGEVGGHHPTMGKVPGSGGVRQRGLGCRYHPTMGKVPALGSRRGLGVVWVLWEPGNQVGRGQMHGGLTYQGDVLSGLQY